MKSSTSTSLKRGTWQVSIYVSWIYPHRSLQMRKGYRCELMRGLQRSHDECTGQEVVLLSHKLSQPLLVISNRRVELVVHGLHFSGVVEARLGERAGEERDRGNGGQD